MAYSEFRNRAGERVYDGVDKITAGDLLLHLQAEPELFPELKGVTSWADLTRDKVTDDFLKRLRGKAMSGDYKGTCPRCPHKG